MKNQTKATSILLFVLLATLAVVSCKKEKKVPNQAILLGRNIPNSSTGNNNDYFLDTVSQVFWGPKTNGSWGNGIAIQGNTMLSGDTTPLTTLGKNGDYFIDTKHIKLFGPKQSGFWSSGISLTGQIGTSTPAIYSPWATSPSNSSDSTIDGTCVRVRYLYTKALSNNLLDKGVLLTYFRVGSIGPYALPYTADAGGATNQINSVYGLNKLCIYRHTFNTCRFNSSVSPAFAGQPVMVNLPQSLEYRFIFIPTVDLITPGIAPLETDKETKIVQIQGMNTPVDLNSLNYDQVCELLHLNK